MSLLTPVEAAAETKRDCCCPAWDSLECARIRHVRSCDDFERSMQREEADCFDSSDACECSCHDYEGYEQYGDDYE